MCVKRKGRLKPATTAHFFDRLRARCENISIVVECAASSTLYDDASSTRQEVIQLLGE